MPSFFQAFTSRGRQLLGAMALVLPTFAVAQADASREVEQRFTQQFSNVPVTAVRPTPYDGLYEIQVGNTLLYADEAVSFVLEGNLIDASTRSNVTAQRQEQINTIDFAELPMELAFEQRRGDGSRVIALFEDPNCGYCKQLRQTLQQVDDITIYTFMYPILSADSHTKVESVWCADERGTVWDDWMLNGITPPTLQCDAPLDDLVALGRQYNVRGTPTMFFADGTRATGALPGPMLEQRLNRADD